ncbi:NUDIX hydrolase [Streptoalloteichus hindustanus]|uniref:NUDIX hydrolase n=1 Tax=Streptoalloteichus hindustanus TaxID=2017 RepID=UPI00116126C5|nr:NUDIX hydrolase [Streptoalloteichus hindustanus]
MPGPPPRDRFGNALLDFRFLTGPGSSGLDGHTPLPLALVVVHHAEHVLMVFDRRRQQWELPGGLIEPHESPAEAAVRELAEETGIHGVHARLTALAEFELQHPPRREYAAVFRTALSAPPTLTVNDEVSAFHWWHPNSPVPNTMSPLDAEIAHRVTTHPHHD